MDQKKEKKNAAQLVQESRIEKQIQASNIIRGWQDPQTRPWSTFSLYLVSLTPSFVVKMS
mgnify:CR=1 FL=1